MFWSSPLMSNNNVLLFLVFFKMTLNLYIYNSLWPTIVCYVHHLMGTLSIEEQIYKSYVKFISKNIMSDKNIITIYMIYVQLTLNGIGEVAYHWCQTSNSDHFNYDLLVSNYDYRIIVYERLYKVT